jgi:hypothetical protein
VSDCEKVGPEREEGGDLFADIRRGIANGAYDPMTCNMLTWYIAEEDDSGRRLRDVYAKVRAKAGMTSPKKKANGHAVESEAAALSAEAEAIMACVTAGFARLEKSLEKLAKAK